MTDQQTTVPPGTADGAGAGAGETLPFRVSPPMGRRSSCLTAPPTTTRSSR